MGAKTCKCDVGEGEEEQLKLSRDPEGKGRYDFPTSTQDLGVSALVGSSGSSHVPPLAPGDHADVAAGMQTTSSITHGKLPAVAEETGEELESLSRQAAESDTGSRAAQTEKLAELKEALLECVDSNGQLVPVPGEERLSRTGADVAAGLQQPSEKEKSSTRISANEERKSSRKEEGKSSRSQQATNLVYSGAATDAALAIEEQRKESRRSANLDNGNGQIIDMTLPVATHLALDSRDDPKSDSKDPQRHSASEKAESLRDCSDTQELEKGQYTCWQMADKSGSCFCPLGSGSLELRRDGRSPSEHYDPHGTGPMVSEHVSALAVPPAQDQGELTGKSRPDSFSGDPPPPPDSIQPLGSDLQAARENGATSPPGDNLRNAGKESEDPAVKAKMESVSPRRSQKEGNQQQDTKAPAESSVPEDDLNAEWLNEGQVNKLQGSSITFASGETCAVEPTSKTTCHMVLEGTVYYGRLSPDRKKLLWSDGDVWIRKEVPKTNAEPPNSQQGETPPAKKESSESRTAANDDDKNKGTPGGETPAEKRPSTASKQSAKDKDKKEKEKEAADKDDGEKKPAKACCTIS